MNRSMRFPGWLILGLVACLGAAGPASDSHNTSIEVSKLHCNGCARKLANKLYTVPGVVGVKANVQKKLMIVIPQKGKELSPKALWEAIESANFTPLSLSGPSGTFKSKPDK